VHRQLEPQPTSRNLFADQAFFHEDTPLLRRLTAPLILSFLLSAILICAGCGGGTSSAPPPPPPATPALKAAVGTQGNFSSGEVNASYTITVSNTGNGATSGAVTVADPPTGFTVTAISGTGWTCTLASTTCTRSDSLAAGASFPAITVTGNVTSPNGTPVTIPVTVSGGGTSSSVTVTPTPTVTVAAPMLSITKSHSGNFNSGQQGAAYTVTVANGASAGASNGKVTVTETVPSGETLGSVSGSGWTCPGAGGANTCDRGDTLSSGTTYPAITVTVNVAANATSPQVNQVSVSGGGMTSTVSTTDSTTINLLPTVSFSANPSSITLGSSATLSWSSTNAASCTAGGAWSQAIATSGTQTVTPTAASLSIPGFLTYTITCQTSTGAMVSGNAALTVTYPAPSGRLTKVRSFEYTATGGLYDPVEVSDIANSLADLVVVANSNTQVLNRASVDPTDSKLILGYGSPADAAPYLEPSLFSGSSLPSWFGNQDPAFPGTYSVQYWNPAWETALFSLIDQIEANGYDGIFFDGFGADTQWSAGNPEGNPVYPDAVSAMATLMTDIRNHVNATYPGKTFYLIGNNPTNVATAFPSGLKTLDVIFNEVAYYQHTADSQNPGFIGNVTSTGIISLLAPAYATAGVPVFGNDYPVPLSDPSMSLPSFDLYSSLGWIPSVSNSPDNDTIFTTGPFMFTATPSNSIVTGYPNFVNFLSGGIAPSATLTGGNMGDYFIGGPGQNTITGGSGNDIIYAHPANAASKEALILDFLSNIAGTGSTPSVSVQVNGNQVIPATPITALFGSSGADATTPQRLQVSVPSSISSVELTITNTSFTDSNDFSNLYIVDIIYNGVRINLGLGSYSNGHPPPFAANSGNGTITFPGSAFAVVPQFLSNTSDVIDGGGGTNTVVYRGPSSNYTVAKQSDGSYLVTSTSTAEGPDKLTNIQILQFSDTQMTLP
jgi:uncharacterized protein (TIGR01370 family)